MTRTQWMLALGGAAASLALWACVTTGGGGHGGGNEGDGTCSGPYPSYWQDAKFDSVGMWKGQEISNRPRPGTTEPVFRLSQQYPSQLPDSSPDEGWWQFNPFKSGLSQEKMSQEANEYIWAVMRYIQAGNVTHGESGGDVEKDWTLCNNPVRRWVHMPFQTYAPDSGREFMHGLTREAPVTFTLKDGAQLKTTVWAVGFYNPRAAYTLGQVWKPDGNAQLPTSNMSFPEGAVIGKLLFTTATPEDLPILTNMPKWKANISDTSFCECSLPSGQACSFQQISEECSRRPGELRLMQFDIAVRDRRSPTGWAYGTFVADGLTKGSEKNPWNRISPLGLMWGNDSPPKGQLASAYPVDARKNGFTQAAIFWDAVDRWNETSDGGHLGCSSRLNGPADNRRSSCLSCHMTASVPDKNRATPAIFNLGSKETGPGQCVQAPGQPDVDAVYFATSACATSFQGGSVVPGPQYADGNTQWISTDFSLQVSLSMAQWLEWQADKVEEASGPRVMQGILPAR
ncbi:hypothetical protein [Hyalangium sp.]|uniref:hypothetical protein n=1 Tax=Hyalangium sp. TaxID=2028555 RepID=UPI002D4D9B15|nr:hypothetical protein [Hyalangium sp.]HYI00886.1 hypothetical protein [Hyalangium sp.]